MTDFEFAEHDPQQDTLCETLLENLCDACQLYAVKNGDAETLAAAIKHAAIGEAAFDGYDREPEDPQHIANQNLANLEQLVPKDASPELHSAA
jgi:hypothetical protein